MAPNPAHATEPPLPTLPRIWNAQGWFQSVYLDEDFRVTRDVRGDVSVLVKG